jgi:hypothetical protein
MIKLALIYNHVVAHTTGAYVERVLKKANIPYTLFGVELDTKIPTGFDLYLRIDHGDYKFDLPAHARPAVFWVIDTHLKKPFKKIKRQAKHYDVIFCAQKNAVERLRRHVRDDVLWLPLGADPDIHGRVDTQQVYDIGFVGRNAMKFARGKQLPLLRTTFPQSFIGEAEYTQMGKIYSSSRIGFNSAIVNDINMRVFEVLAAGTMLLTNKIKDNGLEDLFIDGTHLVTYENDRDLVAKAKYYLEHEDQRATIAAEGRQLLLRRHTYFHRVQSMFNYLAFKFGGDFNQLRI